LNTQGSLLKKEIPINLLYSALVGAAIWALSPSLTGHREPWDSDTLYYFASLLIAGVLLGIFRPRRIWTHTVGIFLGQLLYVLAFLSVGPLIVVGVLFLAGYSLLCMVGAALGSRVRHKIEQK
jgi:hypothetical protein